MDTREARLFIFSEWLKKSRELNSDTALATTLGVGVNTWSKIKLNRSKLGIDVLSTIVLNHPQLNSDWLLTGRGSMLDGKKVLVGTMNGIVPYVPEPYNPLLADDEDVYDPLRGADQYTARLEEGKEIYISGKRSDVLPVSKETEDYRRKYFEVLEKYNQCLERLHEKV